MLVLSYPSFPHLTLPTPLILPPYFFSLSFFPPLSLPSPYTIFLSINHTPFPNSPYLHTHTHHRHQTSQTHQLHSPAPHYRSQSTNPKKGKRTIAPRKTALVRESGIRKVSFFFLPSLSFPSPFPPHFSSPPLISPPHYRPPTKKQKSSSTLTANTERTLAAKAGHLELLAGGKKGKKGKGTGPGAGGQGKKKKTETAKARNAGAGC